MTSPHLIVFSVTQIPLDSPTSSDEFIPNHVRPPWIRPARKKNTPVPRSTPCMESLPQDTSEFASDHDSFAQTNTPFGLMSTHFRREYSAGTASSSGPLLDPAGGARAGVGSGQKPFIPSGELMSIFGDNDLDVVGLLPPSALPGSTIDRLRDAPYRENLARHGRRGSDKMAEFVSSPSSNRS
jgi:hypothetical protein